MIPCILIPSSDEKMTTSPFELDPKLIRLVFDSFYGWTHPDVKGPALLSGLSYCCA
jgi:hypothetical protein